MQVVNQVMPDMARAMEFFGAVEDGPLAATQFHPEKSGDAGATLLANWVEGL